MSVPPSPDLRALLQQGLRRTEARRAVLAALCFVVAGLIAGLYFEQGGGSLRAVIVASVVSAWLGLYGVLLVWLIATSRARHGRFFEVLDRDPGQIARIYGSRLVRIGRRAYLRPIAQPERENLQGRRAVYLVVQLAEPNRLRRVLGLHKYLIWVTREELLQLLDYLHGLAPQAQGPP
jgi:hypothetical protein